MASIKDVAKAAGVGLGSVSRVLNSPDKVSPRTRAKIEAAIEELGFIPNELARNLKTQNSRNVALLVPSIWHPFFSGFAYYIESYLDEEGYKLMLCNSDGHPEKELYYLDMLKQNKVSGIIAITYSQIDEHINGNLPIISFDRHFKNDVTCISSDNFGGGELAAKELIQSGCKKLVYVGTFSNRTDTEVKYRKIGFKNYAEQSNVECALYLAEDPILNYESFLDQFFIRHKEVDGIFVENDNLAMKLIVKAKQLGIRVPEDISVIGFDGIVENEYFSPQLTTIVQPLEKLAKESVAKLLPIIENGPGIIEKIVVPVSIKKGQSTR